jgi:hypothetical protein
MNKWKFRILISFCFGLSIGWTKNVVENHAVIAVSETYSLILPFVKIELFKVNVTEL